MHAARKLAILALLGLLTGLPQARAQTVEIERGTLAAGLWCFPILNRPDEWVYVPARASLATDDHGRPRFSFVRYAFSQEAHGSGGASITQAEGGGIVHFLVRYETPDDQVAAARSELRERLDNDEIRLAGPLVFDSGRYTLVSSILTEDGDQRPHLLASGSAPVLEGNQLALSFHLEPEKAMLLMESFRMDTPDISIVFDLEFAGITDAYEAEVVVDWSQVRESHAFSAGGSVYFVSAEVEAEFDRLVRNNAIQMVSAGEDAAMEALIARIYERLLELMFNPVAPERVPPAERGGLTDAIGALVGQGGLLSSGNTTGFGAHVGYRMKDLRWEGQTVLDFNHRARVRRNAYITFNIGDLYRRYGDDPAFFRAVNPADPTFDQREIHLTVDGELASEFEQLINSASVTLRKRHAGGDITIEERVINAASVQSDTSPAPLVYGWRDDTDRLDWLEYEYRTHWHFRGGGTYVSDWTRSDAAMIQLYAPFQRQRVQLVNTGLDLSALGVRAVVVNLDYPFFGTLRREQMVVRGDQPGMENAVEITLPRDIFDYDYRITWIMADGSRPQLEKRDSSGLIFLDPPPG
ncbi:MAG: hypothetical protein WD397_13075 [Wenzhouxiangellaceae bacterium]